MTLVLQNYTSNPSHVRQNLSGTLQPDWWSTCVVTVWTCIRLTHTVDVNPLTHSVLFCTFWQKSAVMNDRLETLYLHKGCERQLDKEHTVAVVALYQLYSVIPAFTLHCTRYDSIYTIHFAVVFVLSISLLRIYDIVSSLMLTIKVMQMSRSIF